MKILTRWNDKVTYFIILIAILLCFIISLMCWVIVSYQLNEFWHTALVSANSLDVIGLTANTLVSLDMVLAIIGFNLSVVAVFLVSIFSLLYRYKIK